MSNIKKHISTYIIELVIPDGKEFKTVYFQQEKLQWKNFLISWEMFICQDKAMAMNFETAEQCAKQIIAIFAKGLTNDAGDINVKSEQIQSCKIILQTFND
jgi:hypothetical protein